MRGSTPTIPLPTTHQNARIMVVDDQEANIRLLAGILERAGYSNIAVTTNSREALPLFAETQPDLVLLDLMMPPPDGYEILEQLRALAPPDTFLPILVLTADITPESKRRALSTGATDFLTKPFDSIEARLRINNLLHTRHLHMQLQSQNLTLEQRVRDRTQELRYLFQQLITAQEAERRRLSMDMHDGPLQSLGVSILALNRAIARQERGEHEMARQELELLRNSLSDMVAELRGALADLSVELLRRYGLTTALRNHIERLAALMSVEISLFEALDRRLPDHLELLLYRLAQEGLANVRKHAAATKITLTLALEWNVVLLTINDNGRGFDVERTLAQYNDGSGLGLRSMRQRIREAQGDMVIKSAPGAGTTLTFSCPLPSDWEPPQP